MTPFALASGEWAGGDPLCVNTPLLFCSWNIMLFPDSLTALPSLPHFLFTMPSPFFQSHSVEVGCLCSVPAVSLKLCLSKHLPCCMLLLLPIPHLRLFTFTHSFYYLMSYIFILFVPTILFSSFTYKHLLLYSLLSHMPRLSAFLCFYHTAYFFYHLWREAGRRSRRYHH